MVVVVYDDAAYGAEVHHFGPTGDPLDTVTFPETDIAAIGRGYGFEAMTVRGRRRPRRGRGPGWPGRATAPLLIDAKVPRDARVVVAGGGVPRALTPPRRAAPHQQFLDHRRVTASMRRS